MQPSAQNLADGKRWEGSSLKVYLDSRGYATQGIGRHHGIKKGDPDIDEATQARWFAEDWAASYALALTIFPKLDQIDQVRRDALIWLTFNMGIDTLSQFVPFIRYVRLQKWSEAAFHVLTNLSGHLTPYVLQVGARAEETGLRIATGEILEEFACN